LNRWLLTNKRQFVRTRIPTQPLIGFLGFADAGNCFSLLIKQWEPSA
jgi:hypothetical protein